MYFKLNKENLFQKEGYFHIKRALSTDQILKLDELFKKNINYGFKGENDTRLWIDISKNCRKHPISDFIKEIYKLLDLEKISSQLLGERVSCGVAMLNEVNSEFLNSQGSGGGWHRDIYSQGIKIIIYINGANKNNGCLQILRGSHKLYYFIYLFLISLLSSIINLKPIFLVGRSPSYRSKDVNKTINYFFKNSIKTIEGSSGDIIFFNTRCLHRGKPPEFLDLPNRKALTFYCETAEKKNITLNKRRSQNLLLNI